MFPICLTIYAWEALVTFFTMRLIFIYFLVYSTLCFGILVCLEQAFDTCLHMSLLLPYVRGISAGAFSCPLYMLQ